MRARRTLRGGYTAHPKHDQDTGELHAVSCSFGRGNRVQYSVIGVDGAGRRTVDITVTGSPMMHDFSLTKNYVMLYGLPVTFDTRQAAVSVPRALRAPTRLVLSALIGRVRLPDPAIAIAGRGMHGNASLALPLEPEVAGSRRRHAARRGRWRRQAHWPAAPLRVRDADCLHASPSDSTVTGCPP